MLKITLKMTSEQSTKLSKIYKDNPRCVCVCELFFNFRFYSDVGMQHRTEKGIKDTKCDRQNMLDFETHADARGTIF